MQKSANRRTRGSKASASSDFSTASTRVWPQLWAHLANLQLASLLLRYGAGSGFLRGNTVKHMLTAVGALVLVASMASPAQALSITMGSTIIDVGGEDWLMGSIAKDPLKDLCGNGSNPTVELCWANSVLPTTLTGYVKTEDVPVYQTNEDPFVIAFQLPGSDPGNYVVKNSTWHALYTNHDELGWGVININAVPGLNLNEGTTYISHVTSLPEPGTLALLGAGLAMVGVRYRRLRK